MGEKMKTIVGISFLFVALSFVSAHSKEKVIYKYRKYEKFDFEEITVQGETGNPGDLSISPRYQKEFSNILPYKKNFNTEIKKGLERIR